VQNLWQNGKERVGGSVLKLHASAYESGDGTFGADTNYSIFTGSMTFDQVEEVDGRGRGRIAQGVRASRHHNQITSRQPCRFGFAVQLENASSDRHDVEYRSLIRETDTPWRPELNWAVHTAAQTDTSQQVSEERFAPRINHASHAAPRSISAT
jgi:hypothetical protein